MTSNSTYFIGLLEELKELIHVFAASIARIYGSNYQSLIEANS